MPGLVTLELPTILTIDRVSEPTKLIVISLQKNTSKILLFTPPPLNTYVLPIVRMGSKAEIESSSLDAKPPFICLNVREKIGAEEVPLEEFLKKDKSRKKKASVVVYQACAPLEKPVPLHPLTITWSPDKLYFEIKDEVVEQKLWVWNTCYRTIYIHCCDIWDGTAYLGAKWRIYPQTRFHLAPGLKGEMYVRATPKEESVPVPCTYAKLQLAAAHKRDHVTGFFDVPVMIKYSNFVAYMGEGG